MHLAMFNIPVLIASKFNIPYVIWGENSAVEYGNLNKKIMKKNLTKNGIKIMASHTILKQKIGFLKICQK